MSKSHVVQYLARSHLTPSVENISWHSSAHRQKSSLGSLPHDPFPSLSSQAPFGSPNHTPGCHRRSLHTQPTYLSSQAIQQVPPSIPMCSHYPLLFLRILLPLFSTYKAATFPTPTAASTPPHQSFPFLHFHFHLHQKPQIHLTRSHASSPP